jgi:hypothetical protein
VHPRDAVVTGRIWASSLWRGRDFWIRFCVILLSTLALGAVLHLLRLDPEEANDQAMDWVMALYRGDAPTQERSVPITFLDIDEETYRLWGEPLFIPRQRLVDLLREALHRKPALVVVDVDLSRPSGTPGDEELLRLLSAYDRGLPPWQAAARPPILLPATFRRVLASSSDSNEPSGRLERRSSFLGTSFSGEDKVFWASPLFRVEEDGVIRRWRLWEEIPDTGPGGEPCTEVIPSIQLLAAAFLTAPGAKMSDLQCRLSAAVTSTGRSCAAMAGLCPAPSVDDTAPARRLRLGGLDLAIPSSRTGQRIFYRYPAREELRAEESYPLHASFGRPSLLVLPAYPAAEGKPIDPEAMQGRVVVIGGSFPESRDIYRTPLGAMPGSMVLVNSIHSLTENGELRELMPVLRYSLMASFFLVTVFLLTMFGTVRGGFLIRLFVVLVPLPLSLWLFKAGHWLYFALPLAALQIYQTIDEWRGILKQGNTSEGDAVSMPVPVSEPLNQPRATVSDPGVPTNRKPPKNRKGKQRRRARAFLLGTWLWGCGSATVFATPAAAPVCHVEDVQGQVRLERGGRPGPSLVSYLPLYPGDRLLLQNRASHVTLLCGGERLEIDTAKFPYQIRSRASAPSLRENLLSWLGEFFAAWEPREEELASLAARGEGRLALPLITEEAPEIAAGRTVLCLGWKGGEPPYRVRVVTADPGEPVCFGEARARHASIRCKSALAGGAYELEVVDAKGQKVRAHLQVRASSTFPVPPPGLKTAAGDLAGQTLEAGWLAAAGDGRFALEAAQRICEIAPRHTPADRLLRAHEAGFWPDLPVDREAPVMESGGSNAQ